MLFHQDDVVFLGALQIECEREFGGEGAVAWFGYDGLDDVD